MKKILALALVLMMVLSLAACGGKTDPAPSGGSTTDPGTSPQEQQPSDTPDEGTPSDTAPAGDWPDNELTQQVSQPPFNATKSDFLSDDKNLCFTFSDATYEGTKEYAATLRNDGFTDSESEIEKDGMYSFSAFNAAGYYVQLTYDPSLSDGLIISAPSE